MKNRGSLAAWAEVYPGFSYGRLRHEAGELARATRTEHLLEDLVQNGALGLAEAQARYDPGKGITFSSFAIRRVRGAMFDALRKHLPRTRRGEERYRRENQPVEVTAAPCRYQEGYVLTDELPSDVLAFTRRSVPESHVDPESILIAAADVDAARRALASLAEHERTILLAIYDFDEQGDAGDALAERYGFSRTSVSRIHRRVLTRLKRELERARG
jgi:RNA polymerase sigma factor (sigma-70 family)